MVTKSPRAVQERRQYTWSGSFIIRLIILTSSDILAKAFHATLEGFFTRVQHVTHMVVELLFLFSTPSLQRNALWEDGIVILGFTKMRADGDRSAHHRTLAIVFIIILLRWSFFLHLFPTYGVRVSGIGVCRASVEKGTNIWNEQGVLNVCEG